MKNKRIKLIKCNDPFVKLKPGLLGTILSKDALGTVHVQWDDGHMLGLCYDGGDRWLELP